MSEHTPGPWKLETVKTQVGICHRIGPFPPARPRDEPSHACIYVDGRYKPEDDPVSLANARLIAAAPDLLAACEALLDALQTGLLAYNTSPGEEAGRRVAQAREAIAKAKSL